ncbi:MAG TPA: protein-tyrosine phosphatase family protein [Pseudolabrys sp.]|nr:protein-tyrosine phosphatase family protein [Pseudolabrys sp.]
MIHVCSLARLYATVDETRARHIVTLLRLTDRVTRPSHIAPENHLVLAVDDIVEAQEGYTAPAEEHVRRLIAFVGGWDRAAPMVVHCFAGISRSTAGAYVAACALNPERDELEIAQSIRRASRTAQPNARIVGIADRLLKRDGRMIGAVEAIGPGLPAMEGEPFRLDLA